VHRRKLAALYLRAVQTLPAPTDPAPDAEANLRVTSTPPGKTHHHWPFQERVARSPEFTTDLKKALADADLVQENGPERKDFKIKLFADNGCGDSPDTIIASSSPD